MNKRTKSTPSTQRGEKTSSRAKMSQVSKVSSSDSISRLAGGHRTQYSASLFFRILKASLVFADVQITRMPAINRAGTRRGCSIPSLCSVHLFFFSLSLESRCDRGGLTTIDMRVLAAFVRARRFQFIFESSSFHCTARSMAGRN